MPAVSQSQQKLMAQAYQVKKFILSNGKEGIDPVDIDSEYRQQIKDLADSMSKAELKRFAETKIKDLPKKVKEAASGFLSGGPFPQFYSFVSNIAQSLPYTHADNKDPLIKKFMDFIENDDTDDVKEAGISAVPTPPGVAATAHNTSGVGNVALPTPTNVGSGDRFDNNIDNAEDKIGIMSYEDYKKWLKRWKNKKKQ